MKSGLESIIVDLYIRLRVYYIVYMVMRVLYFGLLKDLLGRSEEVIILENGINVEQLLQLVRSNHKAIPLDDVLKSCAVAVNLDYAQGDTVINDGDEVALMPPVSSG